MLATGNDVVYIIENFAPVQAALGGDSTGLQWGDLNRETAYVLLALDFNEEVLEEALSRGASFIFTHHPYLFQPLSQLDLRDEQVALMVRALKEGISLYSAHTNLDAAPWGVSHALGELLGLKDMEVLFPTGSDDLEKLVVFTPQGYEEKVREAICSAGAGWLGNYSCCTFQQEGTGTFMPGEGTTPFIGSQGSLQKVREYRLETVFPRSRRSVVLQAMEEAHPYEEVAFDLYPLHNDPFFWGLGKVGVLKEKITFGELCQRCKKLLAPRHLKALGDLQLPVEKIAVLGGSGAPYMENALEKGAQAYITGDIKFHDAQKAERKNLALIDAGHEATEWPILPALADYLREKLGEQGFTTGVLLSQQQLLPWRVL